MLEIQNFGPDVGEVAFYQLESAKFNDECDSRKTDHDATGYRVYSGLHVAIRFTMKVKTLLQSKSVIELGCGVGAFSLLACSRVVTERLVLTDNEPEAIKLTSKNIALFDGLIPYVKSAQLLWGDREKISQVVDENLKPFEVVLGSELMYYRTDLDSLVQTVIQLTNNHGIFLHAHLFRKSGQITEMNEKFHAFGWISMEMKHKHFLLPEELRDHPEWYRMRALLTGPKEAVERICAEMFPGSWIACQEEMYDDNDEKEEGEAGDEGMCGVGSLFR